jgi:hypothetical protein
MREIYRFDRRRVRDAPDNRAVVRAFARFDDCGFSASLERGARRSGGY